MRGGRETRGEAGFSKESRGGKYCQHLVYGKGPLTCMFSKANGMERRFLHSTNTGCEKRGRARVSVDRACDCRLKWRGGRKKKSKQRNDTIFMIRGILSKAHDFIDSLLSFTAVPFRCTLYLCTFHFCYSYHAFLFGSAARRVQQRKGQGPPPTYDPGKTLEM